MNVKMIVREVLVLTILYAGTTTGEISVVHDSGMEAVGEMATDLLLRQIVKKGVSTKVITPGMVVHPYYSSYCGMVVWNFD